MNFFEIAILISYIQILPSLVVALKYAIYLENDAVGLSPTAKVTEQNVFSNELEMLKSSTA